MSRGIFWLTGLPSAGKTTVAEGTVEKLGSNGQKVELFDDDVFRKKITPHLGFTGKDQATVLYMAMALAQRSYHAGHTVICAYVSSDRGVRDAIGKLIRGKGIPFYEVYVEASAKVCERRDVKGTWARARDGYIEDFQGFDAEYMRPLEPDLVINTEHDSVSESIMRLVDFIEEKTK